MASLLTLLDLSLHFGGPAILDKVNLQLEGGERVCLVGRNGAGKTTLMKVIMGDMKPDTGDLFRPQGAVFARLAQEVPTDLRGSVHDIVSSGLRPNDDGHEEDWKRDVRVEDLIRDTGLEPGRGFQELSGGLKRRALLARAIRTCCCSTKRPTTSISNRSYGWKSSYWRRSRLFSSSRTTALSCARSPRASLNSTGAALQVGLATTTPTSSANRTSLRRRKSNAWPSTRNWRRRRNGFAEASGPSVRAPRRASTPSRPCAPRPGRGAKGSAPPNSSSPRPSARGKR